MDGWFGEKERENQHPPTTSHWIDSLPARDLQNKMNEFPNSFHEFQKQRIARQGERETRHLV